MFDIGFQEITLIGVIALIVVGPERLPRMARTLGLWAGKLRYHVNQVKQDIDREVRAQELKELLDKPARELEEVYQVAEETKGTLTEAKSALGDAKAAFEEAPAGVSTPNEPAAGSIFPAELPAADPGPETSADPGPAQKDHPGPETSVDPGPAPKDHPGPETSADPASDAPEPTRTPADADAAPGPAPRTERVDSPEPEPVALATTAAGDDDERKSERT